MQYNTKDASLKLISNIKCYTDKIETLKVYTIRYNRFLFKNMVIFNFYRTKQTQLSLLVLDLRSSIAETCTYMIVILFFFQAFFYLFKLFLYKQKENTTLKLIKLLLRFLKRTIKPKKYFYFINIVVNSWKAVVFKLGSRYSYVINSCLKRMLRHRNNLKQDNLYQISAE